MNLETCSDLPSIISARRELTAQGYTLSDEILLLEGDRELRKQCVVAFAGDLQADYVTFHPDRQRLRNVYEVGYSGDGKLQLTETDSIAIENRNMGGKREYKRADFLSVAHFENLLARLYLSIPETDRSSIRLIEVDYMRTRNVVTNTIHRDFRDYVGIFCLQKHGQGAETHLYLDLDGKECAYKHVLSPGEVLLFRDENFYHFTTDLEAETENSLRDVFIIIFGD